MLGEEAARGGYLATVRCVNPPPLAERRVSAGDAGAPPAADDAPRYPPTGRAPERGGPGRMRDVYIASLTVRNLLAFFIYFIN